MAERLIFSKTHTYTTVLRKTRDRWSEGQRDNVFSSYSI